MKRCSICGVEKPLDEFYRATRGNQGRQPYCKPCESARSRAWHQRNPRPPNPHRLEKPAPGTKLAPEVTAKLREKKRQWRLDNLEKVHAQTAVYRAVRDGRLVRKAECEDCGRVGPVQAHHDDYSRQLEVRWICPRCHRRFHTELRKQAAPSPPIGTAS